MNRGHLLLLAVVSCVPAADELLVNPSFEAAGATEDRAAGWNHIGAWINRETSWSPVLDGSCVLGYHHWQIEDGQDSLVYQDVAAKRGERYRLSVQVRIDSPATGSLPDAIEVRLEDVAGERPVTVAARRIKAADARLPDQPWTSLAVTGIAQSDRLRALIIVSPGPAPRNGAIAFDAASLTPVR